MHFARSMLSRILSGAEDELVREERRSSPDSAPRWPVSMPLPNTSRRSSKSIEQLDELFLLVIVGEFNSGKSAFINALVGSTVAQEGVTPTTAQINVLQYGETLERQVREAGLHVITAPARDPPRDPHRRYARDQRDHP